jgi:VIT1/CCC1 family predicted Fe2+/Mn2+ transporter
MRLADLLPVLQIAVGPVILISGVGLLLLAMTNRLGRTIDRARTLVERRNHASQDQRLRNEEQLKILWRRAMLQRTSITLAAIGALLAAVLVIVLFVGVLSKLEISFVVVGLFIACLAAVIGSLIYFIRDIDLSLHALALEMERHEADRD